MTERRAAAVCVLDEISGKIALTEAFSIWANMPRKRLIAGLTELTGKPCALDDPQHAAALSSGAFPLGGAEASCLCSFSLGRLRSVELNPLSGTAAERRALLFHCIGAQDPCPQTMQNVLGRYAFGTVWVVTDPRSGGASLRITYAAKE
jgi:hypothetical protein